MFRTAFPTARNEQRTKRAASTTVIIESLEDRALFSTAAPVAQSPGTSTSPGPVLANLSPTFKWSAVTSVDGYQIHIYDKTEAKMLSTNVGASLTSYTPSAGTLHPGDQFVWNVRDLFGTSTKNTTGPVSNYLNFQLRSMPAPTVTGQGSTISPGPALTTSKPIFSWKPVTAVTGFSGYQINLYDETTHKLQSFVASPTATSYTPPPTDLTPGDTYVWNLRLRDGSLTGPESQPYLFFHVPSTKTSLPAPLIISPGSSKSPGPMLTTLTPTFKWHGVTNVSGLTGYQINLYDITTGKFVSHTVGASVTQYTLSSSSPLTAGDDYVWNVRVLANSTSGPPSVYAYFVA